MVRAYARNILAIINNGIETGEIKSDTDPIILRKVILGAIEHACLGEIIFSKEVDARAITNRISKIIFDGVRT